MTHRNTSLDYDDFDDLDGIPLIRNMPPPRPFKRANLRPNIMASKPREDPLTQFAEVPDWQGEFEFTYNASRHERKWILDSLGGFFDSHWLDDILRLVKGGKEAHVYQCKANTSVPGLDAPYIAAKVYRPRMFRNLRNDHIYREGRAPLDSDGNVIIKEGDLHAIQKRTGYGLKLIHTSWIEYEYQALSALHAAGADVPKPMARGDNAILMSFIGDENGAAPTLNSISLDPLEAKRLYERTLRNIEIMLAQDLVHGDLSAYNLLYWDGEITLIDFPQVIDPHVNRSAYQIFARDVTRVCEYFSQQGLRCNRGELAPELWTAYGHRLSPEVHPSLLDEDDQRDRAYWQKNAHR